jgi:glucokinase
MLYCREIIVELLFMPDQIVSVDLGGTKIRVALCDADGHIIKQTSQLSLAHEGSDAVFARIVATIHDIAEDFSNVRGIGLGAPGTINPWDGVLLEAPNLPGMDHFPIKARLENEFRVPTFAGNDANMAALGEQRFGAGRGVAHMIYVTISTGIGGGIIVNGKLHLGARGFAGEVGHQTLDAYGPICSCGNVGCLEALAAGPAIARNAREEIHKGRQTILLDLVNGDHTKIHAGVVNQAARQGDKLSLRVFDRAGFFIGLGLVSLLHNFDTQLFVLGGGVAINAWDLLYPTIEKTFAKYAMVSMRPDVKIVPAELGDDAGLLGAVALVSDQINK